MHTEYRVVTLIAQDKEGTLLGSTSFCLTSKAAASKFLSLFTWDSLPKTEEDFVGFCQTNQHSIKRMNRVKFPISISNYLQGTFTCQSLATYLDARIDAGF